ncbi:unnamed protein product, partial [Nesidiocoris tenuis]
MDEQVELLISPLRSQPQLPGPRPAHLSIARHQLASTWDHDISISRSWRRRHRSQELQQIGKTCYHWKSTSRRIDLP